MVEEWRTVLGVDISSHGRSKHRQTGQVFLPESWGRGYRRISIGRKHAFVHRLVALAFLGPPKSEKDTVDHIDRDKGNNMVTNLRWASKAEQRANQKPHAQFQDTMPIEINKGDGIWHRFACMSECCRAFNLDVSMVSKCMRGKRKSHKGCTFRKVEAVPIPGERWDTVHGIDVSSAGRIRNRKSGTIWMPRPTDGHAGYCYVADPAGKMHSVHRLVAQGFLAKPIDPKLSEVDHIDRDRSNNCVANLRWAGRSQQVHNRKTLTANVKNCARPVRSIDQSGNVREYPSGREASKATGAHVASISRVALGKQKSSVGYKFEFC